MKEVEFGMHEILNLLEFQNLKFRVKVVRDG